MENNIRINAEYIEYEELKNGYKRVYLVGKNGEHYSRKDIEEICGISERKQRDLIETNKPMNSGIYGWKVEKFRILSELLKTTIEDLINREDYQRLADEVNSARIKVESEGHKRKPR
ncbi:MAG: hypothetical protein K1W00_03445 [Lachnospiraceae bacterium]